MKSVSVIDKAFSMSEQNKMLKEILNSSNIEKMEDLKQNYIMPILKEKNIEMPDDDFIIETWKKTSDYTMGFIKRWMDGYIKKDLEQKYNYLNHQKLMPNMTRFSSKVFDVEEEDKKLLANMFAEFIYKLSTFETKCNEYLNDYIIPILEKEETIIFDMSSTDENIQTITQKTLELFLKYIHEHGSMTFHNSIFEGQNPEEIIDMVNYFNFLYVDDIKTKETLAKLLCNVFIFHYNNNNIDLTKKPSANIKYLYLAVPKEWLEMSEDEFDKWVDEQDLD